MSILFLKFALNILQESFLILKINSLIKVIIIGSSFLCFRNIQNCFI